MERMDLSDLLIRINIFYSSGNIEDEDGETYKENETLGCTSGLFSMQPDDTSGTGFYASFLRKRKRDPSEHQHGLIPSSSL